MIVEHADGVLALLNLPGNITVYDGRVPDAPSIPYVVVYANSGAPENASMADLSDWQHFNIQTTVVGLLPEQVRMLADRVNAALLDRRPTVAGRVAGQLMKLGSQPIRRDNDVTPPLFYASDTWTFTSVPA